MQLSPIQDFIISRLKNAASLRYSDMRPDDTPNDLYNYHLKQLLSKELVEKTDGGYCLSPTGQRHVADIHHTSDPLNRLFKLNVITIVSRVIDGEVMILNQARTSNPSYGKVGVMGGTVIKGEPLLAAAARKLYEETGLSADFRLVGWERRRLYKHDALFSDVIFPLTYTDTSTGEPIDTDYGHNLWVPIEEAIRHETNPSDSIASIITVLEAVQDGVINELPMFFHEAEQHS
jgi:8-oxo-dGTP pyrophosphatase MutT (NUDIX family)